MVTKTDRRGPWPKGDGPTGDHVESESDQGAGHNWGIKKESRCEPPI